MKRIFLIKKEVYMGTTIVVGIISFGIGACVGFVISALCIVSGKNKT